MIHSIQNDTLRINVSESGAELQNIIKKSTQQEYLWHGDPSHWARRAPVLFPIVGALQEGYFLVGDDRYTLGQHGFARDASFELKETSESRVTCVLASNKKTLAI